MEGEETLLAVWSAVNSKKLVQSRISAPLIWLTKTNRKRHTDALCHRIGRGYSLDFKVERLICQFDCVNFHRARTGNAEKAD